MSAMAVYVAASSAKYRSETPSPSRAGPAASPISLSFAATSSSVRWASGACFAKYLYASYFYPKIWMVALDKGGVTCCKPHSLRHYYGSRLLYAGVPENDVADWMGHSSTDVLREHYHYIFEGAEQRGRAAIATMLTPGADDLDDPTDASEVA
ncbi:tyrosine-type recombinase/integrase [Streptomyces sp. b94]|uniref:tyrosine-type recombinase/integrase n=1 Tax=Streptomyces sp. b94 TaxID=1827634 RepID=UPI001FFD35FB|nr:tyrosine-type recombinase/integrase [Streptomyces sp. b94]